MRDLNETPMSSRFTIGLFGRRNAGKSSLINALTNQSIALTSPVAGTTADPVYKAMELLPIGPVAFIDTAGLDDEGELGRLRVEKTYEALRKCDMAIVVADREMGAGDFERAFIRQLRERKIPSVFALNKCDDRDPPGFAALEKALGIPAVCVSAERGRGIEALKALIVKNSNREKKEPNLVSGLINPGDMAVLVTPIDAAAPKGRLILPQQQTIRDILESGAVAVVTKERELKLTLERLREPPGIVITDSQVFSEVAADTPPEIPMTSFSILFARQKADLAEMARGIKRIKRLKAGERVLIVEGCTHHRQEDDIGTVKIPRWIRRMAGDGIEFDWASGACFPKDVSRFAVVVHCGGCMLNRGEMAYRVARARGEGVAVTNYGLLIACAQGILERALKPFPAALAALKETEF